MSGRKGGRIFRIQNLGVLRFLMYLCLFQAFKQT